MKISRRAWLAGGAGVTAGFLGLRHALSAPAPGMSKRYGRLRAEPLGYLALPEGFSCAAISRAGETMDDGLRVPGHHDGMGAFPGPDGRTLLVRNHELEGRQAAVGPFGSGLEGLGKIPPSRLYDAGGGRYPGQGGTTTLVYDTRARRLERHFLSLAGTWRNCAGGPTPWNSWLSCEEDTRRASGLVERDHGYVFEVPASGTIGLADPIPLKAMGRFNHEAAAVEPVSGAVLLTEDRPDGLLYRFTPSVPGELRKGGRLQALALPGRPTTRGMRAGETAEVAWIDLDGVDAPNDDLRRRGARAGAATFDRGEGIWTGADGIYFCATAGGAARKGQVWRYRPETLELFCEPGDADLLENCDNVTIAPWGDLFLCEDGPGWQRIVAVTPKGELYTFAENVYNTCEVAGGCFSPDGTTFFFNIQRPGVTLAVTGPWKSA
ncbi:MAG TPA: alkaline phosphatase PhoX [Planctomycetota bacterium]